MSIIDEIEESQVSDANCGFRDTYIPFLGPKTVYEQIFKAYMWGYN